MKNVLLVTPDGSNEFCPHGCSFSLTEEQKLALQQFYGPEELRIKNLPCDNISSLPDCDDMFSTGEDCDILVICPYFLQEMFDSCSLSNLINTPQDLLTIINNTWIKFSIKPAGYLDVADFILNYSEKNYIFTENGTWAEISSTEL